MKQITPEIKAKIFALYWGQYIAMHPEQWPTTLGDIIVDDCKDVAYMNDLEGCFLNVTPLSSITDEDAIELNASLLNMTSTLTTEQIRDIVIFMFSDYKDNSYKILHQQFHPLEFVNIADYLRSKSYALPAFGYSADELVEAGVFKLKEE